jgi:hypothetical protein
VSANLKFSLPTFLAPTITSVTSEQVAWPATYALTYYYIPKRPWKTTAKNAAQRLVLDFGTTTALQMLYIAWTNYAYVKVQGSADNSSYTTLTPSGYTSTTDGLLIPQDTDMTDLRRRLLVDLTGLFNYRYLRLEIVADLTTDDGASVYSTGTIIPGALLTEMNDPMGNAPDFSFPDPESVNEFAGGSKEFNELGVPRVMMDWNGPFIHESAITNLRAIQRIGSRPFVVYPCFREGGVSVSTAPDPGKAYLMRRLGDSGRRYSSSGLPEVLESGFSFEEVV